MVPKTIVIRKSEFVAKTQFLCLFSEMRCMRHKIHIGLFLTYIFTDLAWIITNLLQVKQRIGKIPAVCLTLKTNMNIYLSTWCPMKHFAVGVLDYKHTIVIPFLHLRCHWKALFSVISKY